MRSRCATKTPNVLGTYQGLQESAKRILLDFSKVVYLNSSARGHIRAQTGPPR